MVIDPLDPLRRDVARIGRALGIRRTVSDEEGRLIARQIGGGLFFNGIQWDHTGKKFAGYMFTDTAVTGSTYTARNLEEARDKLIKMRHKFKTP